MKNVNVIHQEIDRLAQIDAQTIEKEIKKAALIKAGFIQSSEIQGDTLASEEKQKTYYKLKYPKCQFLTSNQFFHITEKYNLKNATLDNYTGFVPAKQLKLITDFKLDPDDTIPPIYILRCKLGRRPFIKIYNEEKPDINLIRNDINNEFKLQDNNINVDYVLTTRTFERLCIAATPNLIKDDGNTFTQTSESGTLQFHVIDPIVYQQVPDGILVIAKWGDEASDILINDCPYPEGSDQWANWMIDNNT